MPPIMKMTKKQRYDRAYYTLHKEEIAEQTKSYYKSHKAEIAEKRKAYYKSHKAEVKAYHSETLVNHIGRANRSAKKYGLKGKLTLAEVTGMFERYDDKCFYCGVKLVDAILHERHPADRSVDHFIPFSAGGKNVISNVRPCCFSCNLLKYRDVEGWYENCNVDGAMVEIMAERRRERQREYSREYYAHKKLERII